MSWSRFGLAGIALAVWATAAAATLAPVSAAPLALAAWTLALGITALVSRRSAGRRALLLALLAAAACAGAASHVALAQPGRTAVADEAIAGGRSLEITAVVTGKVERRASGELAFDAVADGIRLGSGPRTAVRIDIAVHVQPDDVEGEGLDVGARIRAVGAARHADPGDRSVFTLRATGGLHVVTPPSGVLATTSALRRGLVETVDGLPSPGADLVPGLAVGDTALVGPELDTAMKASSLSHLTAVSGANCALVVGLAFGAAALLGAPRGVRIAAGLAALGGFSLLVTPEPSVARAAAMAAVAMLALLLGRPAAGLNLLGFAIVLLLVADPWLSTSLGFALSAAATASLLVFARPLAHGLTRWMPRPLALGLAVPLAAQLACGPLLVLIAPTVPLYGIAANVLAAPAAPIATVVGLAACLAGPFPWLASGLAAVAWVPAAWIGATAQVAAELPGSQVPWLEGIAGLVTLGIVGAAVGVLIAVVPSRGRRPQLARRAAGGVVAVVTGVLVGGALLTWVVGRWTLPSEWSVLACDVGQGDAVLVRSAGAVALIDTGPESAALDSCLARAGIARIDLLVLTHFDLDHVGGVEAVRGRVGAVLSGPPATSADEGIVAALAADGAEPVAAYAGLHGTLGGAAWRVVWPPRHSRAFPSGNDASVVLEITGDGVPHALFLGDLSASPQRALGASAALDPPYDLVKVAHHGSADQAPTLYAELRPAIALVTVGTGNDYGHPRDETLALLAESGARIARTDADGVIAVWLDDGIPALWRDRGVAPRR